MLYLDSVLRESLLAVGLYEVLVIEPSCVSAIYQTSALTIVLSLWPTVLYLFL